ncbi:YIP1 family protein [Anaerobacillus sp. MEB173]|uniref:YIP1 family protein n=1 Tax=Anaerobacillus sp. MEB173 TaxID=3383345 RepID=UPI003F93D5B2
MTSITTILRTLIFDKHSIKEIIESPKWNKWSHFITLLLGLFYGYLNILHNRELIMSFETDFLRNILVPGFFILGGLLMLYITRFGLTLLLWAGAKGAGGPGYMAILNRLTAFALIPLIIALPAFMNINAGDSISTLGILTLVIGLAWMYLFCVKVLEVSQKISTTKAYIAVVFVFIFFISVFYMVTPPPAK